MACKTTRQNRGVGKWFGLGGAQYFSTRHDQLRVLPRGATPSHSDSSRSYCVCAYSAYSYKYSSGGCLRECGAVGHEQTAEIRGTLAPMAPPVPTPLQNIRPPLGVWDRDEPLVGLNSRALLS